MEVLVGGIVEELFKSVVVGAVGCHGGVKLVVVAL